MKIIIPTVSRSDFGILSSLVKTLKKDKKFKIKTLVTGEHYSKKMGNTFKEISKNKIKINSKIKLNEYKSNPISILKKSSKRHPRGLRRHPRLLGYPRPGNGCYPQLKKGK